MGHSSFTLSLSGTSSILETNFFPPIDLHGKNYVLGLIELLTYNSIPNIEENKNKFYVDKYNLQLPVGSYELADIEKFLKDKLEPRDVSLFLKANNNTLTSEIQCSHKIDFRPIDSINEILGFDKILLEENTLHTSSKPVKIVKVNSLCVECNITSGAYNNGEKVHTIHEFFPVVPAGYKIIEIPSKVIYLPVTVKEINFLQIKIVDQNGDLVNLRGENITVRLHLKAQ